MITGALPPSSANLNSSRFDLGAILKISAGRLAHVFLEHGGKGTWGIISQVLGYCLYGSSESQLLYCNDNMELLTPPAERHARVLEDEPRQGALARRHLPGPFPDSSAVVRSLKQRRGNVLYFGIRSDRKVKGLRLHLRQFVENHLRKTARGSFQGIERRQFGQQNRSEEHTSELQSLLRISYAVFCLKKTSKRSTKGN